MHKSKPLLINTMPHRKEKKQKMKQITKKKFLDFYTPQFNLQNAIEDFFSKTSQCTGKTQLGFCGKFILGLFHLFSLCPNRA